MCLQVKPGGHGTGHLYTVWAGSPALLKATRLEAALRSAETPGNLPSPQSHTWVNLAPRSHK